MRTHTTTEHHNDGSFTVTVHAAAKTSALAASELAWVEARRTDPSAARTGATFNERADGWDYRYTFTPR
ncbi:hypothetical protein ACOKM3_14115 [Streptomyces sp. BH106]|uniref:hypothetical protein n=1 Tax=Streptomyces sp. BH106 TaxID=3410409 RepID=UPI003CF4992B